LAAGGYLAECRVPVHDLRVRLLGPAGFRIELDRAALNGISPEARAGLLARVAEAGVGGNGDVVAYHSGALSG
jgi:hypothetical protein